jgi:hypothetical protein
MGTNSTYFFQPGEPSRTNLTPELNQKLTLKIAGYHAKALDKIGSSYFIEENYDDFIMVLSSYPDINGSIGILFEQQVQEVMKAQMASLLFHLQSETSSH